MFAKFKWLEPVSLRNKFAPDLNLQPSHKVRLILAAVISLLLLGLNRLAEWGGGDDVPSLVGIWWLIPIGSTVLAYLLPWIQTKCSRQVRMTEKTVVVSFGNRLILVSRWDQVKMAEIRGNEPPFYLEIADENGSRVKVGLGPNVRKRALEVWLRERILSHK